MAQVYARPAARATDIQKKNALALIRQAFEIRLYCTVKNALQSCKNYRTELEMQKVGGCCIGTERLFALLGYQLKLAMYYSLHDRRCKQHSM